MSMNQVKSIGLDDAAVKAILQFNDRLKSGRVTGYIRDVAIDFYCDYLCAMHPECRLQTRRN